MKPHDEMAQEVLQAAYDYGLNPSEFHLGLTLLAKAEEYARAREMEFHQDGIGRTGQE